MKDRVEATETTGLNRIDYVAYVFCGLVGLGLLKRWIQFEWPFQTAPLCLALVLAALVYGADKGFRGRSLGSPNKSWIIARQMVLTTVICLLVLRVVIYVFDGAPVTMELDAFALIGAELAVSLVASFVLCRYAFVLGVTRGYAAFRKKEKHAQ